MPEIITTEIVSFANELADISAQIAKKYFRLPNDEIKKEDGTPVTKADKEIERAIREKIIAKFPSHGIIGEEEADINPSSKYQWILDPIDGTSSFIIGRPIFGTLIALSYNKEVMLGIMNQPITNERWLGIKENPKSGSWLNNQPIKTRSCKNLNDAIFCTTSPFFFQGNDATILQNLTSKTKYQNYGGVVYGGDCYLYSLLASGFIDIIIDPGLKVYDYAAMIPIIEMAGGIVTDWQGNKMQLQSNAKLLACGDKELHKKALQLLN